MSSRPDLSIPRTAPVEQYHHSSRDTCSVALYTLTDLFDEELRKLRDESDYEQDFGEPGDNLLRAVYDYHLELGAQELFDPICLIVNMDWGDWKKWKGIPQDKDDGGDPGDDDDDDDDHIPIYVLDFVNAEQLIYKLELGGSYSIK
ncbi:hypothetical protein K469DRAFT_692197 [Zopfia rhizophila CBS 207.26]|uniref:Uncharacterized protein n=1 Tax=Zopfia rhizophila CBS 207.26 TaxID=1314779 RepID=A0A6A6DQU3_9PEZI|nr:hypothetical protein K469DRAFT_692197 [Zopfia rhizophila CBS 207.26]